MNHELNKLIENADIVRFIKRRRIAWLGHVMRMDETRTPKRVGRRIRGRPRKRWIEDVEEDIQRMWIRGCRKLCKERTEWKRITEKAKTDSKRRRRILVGVLESHMWRSCPFVCLPIYFSVIEYWYLNCWADLLKLIGHTSTEITTQF